MKFDERPILVVDGLNFFIRNFIANPTTSLNGDPAGGFLGFIKGLSLLCEQFRPTEVLVAWESGGSAKRRGISSSYKSGRRPVSLNRYYEDDIPDTQENYHRQISLTVEALKKTPVSQIYIRDAEADDVIAYLVKYKFKDDPVFVVSSDKDFYQLIDDRVKQWSPNQKKVIDKAAVLEKFGVSTVNFAVAKCFAGDNSDSTPGVKGTGFRSLAKRFPQLGTDEFFSVEQIIETATERLNSSKLKIYSAIIENAEVVRKNWQLMYLDMRGLSADHVQKIESQLDSREYKTLKIDLMRLMIREGLSNFDIDRAVTAFNIVRMQQ